MCAWKQQTTVQEATSIRFGSAKFEVGDDVGSLVDVGAIRDGVWEETFDKVEVMSDNAGAIELGIRNHFAFLSGNLMEINLEKLAKFYKGVHKHETVAASQQTITDESITLDDYDFESFLHREGDGTEAADIVVQNAAASLTLLRDCDYIIAVLANGFTGIARAHPAAVITGSVLIAVTTTHTITLSTPDFDVDPAPGDHLILSGFIAPYTANNRVVTVDSVTTEGSVFTVTETLADCAEGVGDAGTITILRGGIADEDIVLVDYKYTPLASRTLKSGGITTFTPQVARFTNYNAAGKVFRATIWEATPEGGIKIDFPADMDEDPAMCPIRIKGRLDKDLTSGEQLWELYDEQHAS